MIEVVSALIIDKGRVLLTQRRADQDFAGRWESPGGKVEGNESWHDAIRRELREEIGVEVSAISEHALWCGEVQRPQREPVFVEGQGIGWFGPQEFAALPLLPANDAARAKTAEAILYSVREGQ